MKCLLIIAALLSFIPTQALSRGHCVRDMEAALANLGKNHKEAPIAQGINGAGALVQVWSTKDGKTWTITIDIPKGPICMLQSGSDWQAVPFDLPGPGA